MSVTMKTIVVVELGTVLKGLERDLKEFEV